jgi:aminoglycoside 6'-N-acetyltransferase
VGALPPRVIAFRPFTAEDLALLRVWLEREHVRLWWREPIEHELAEDPAGRFVILVDGRPVGMIQSYEAEVDLLIGEEDLIGHGLGPQVLSQFAREVVFARPGVTAVVATVEEGSRRSWRAFEKAGFRHVADVEEEGRPHRLMRLDRS